MNEKDFAVIVEFLVSPESRETFLEHVVENAKTSVDNEPDCLRFDVFEDSRSERILLFEIYRSAEAFEAHLATDHFLAFDRIATPMTRRKKVHTLYARHTTP